jgi:hypothetical protein
MATFPWRSDAVRTSREGPARAASGLIRGPTRWRDIGMVLVRATVAPAKNLLTLPSRDQPRPRRHVLLTFAREARARLTVSAPLGINP